jgi:hypothetical protein
MSFELRITITGLSLFLPGPPNQSTAMHVFLPKCRHEPHLPRVWYDGAYESDDPNVPTDPYQKRKQADLPKHPDIVDFRYLRVTPGVVEHLPDSVPCLSCATRRNFDLNKMKNIESHLVLPPGRAALSDAMSLWNWLGADQRLTGQVVWQVEVNDSSLQPIPKAKPQLPALYPKDGVIELFVSNAVSAASKFPPPISGPKPELNKPMPHFEAYYDLYDPSTPDDQRKYPIYKGTIGFSAPYSCLSSGGH